MRTTVAVMLRVIARHETAAEHNLGAFIQAPHDASEPEHL
jgi:hypothetical protein